MAFELTSPAFEHGGRIPRKYTCDGEDRSPPLRWSGAPPGTKSFVLLMSCPKDTAVTYRNWGAYDIPEDWTGLDEGFGPESLDDGIRQVINSSGQSGYAGPCPESDREMNYVFRLMALSTANLEVTTAATCDELASVAERYVLAETELVGAYRRS